MRIMGLELRRFEPEEVVEVVEAASTNGKKASARSAIGASGTIISDGYLSPSEYNPDLVGARALRMWQRMRLSDATVREALGHIYAPIVNATWDVEPASDDPLDLEVAEFSRRCFQEWLVEPWQATLRTALLYLPQGHQVFETVEQVVEAELTYEPPLGDPVTVPKRQFVVWRMFAHRRPETIQKWNTKNGELESIEQVVFSKGTVLNPVIPADRLVVLTNEKEGDEWTGTSVLRTAYKAWVLKELVEKIAGIAFERHGVGIPVGYLPEARASDDALMERVEGMLRDMRAGESHYLVFPGPKAGTNVNSRDGYLVEILSPSGSIPDFLPFLEYMRGEIKGNVLARFAELGHGSVGARATGDVQSQVWYTALQATADYVAAVFGRSLRLLIDRNYTVERYPRVVARDIEARNISEFSDATSKLISSGAAVADRSLRGAVRQFMGWPDEDEPEEAGQDELGLEDLGDLSMEHPAEPTPPDVGNTDHQEKPVDDRLES